MTDGNRPQWEFIKRQDKIGKLRSTTTCEATEALSVSGRQSLIRIHTILILDSLESIITETYWYRAVRYCRMYISLCLSMTNIKGVRTGSVSINYPLFYALEGWSALEYILQWLSISRLHLFDRSIYLGCDSFYWDRYLHYDAFILMTIMNANDAYNF